MYGTDRTNHPARKQSISVIRRDCSDGVQDLPGQPVGQPEIRLEEDSLLAEYTVPGQREHPHDEGSSGPRPSNSPSPFS